MAITFTHRLKGADSTNDGATYTTGSVTPATDGSPMGLVVCFFHDVSGAAAIASTVVGLGLTWTAVQNTTTVDMGTSTARFSVWKGVGTASTGTVVLTPSAATISGVQYCFFQMAGAHATTPFVTANKVESSSTSAATSGSLTLPNAITAGNATLGYFAHLAAEDITAGTDFTKGTNTVNMATPSSGLNYEYKTANVNTTVNATWATSSGWIGAGIEVAAAADTADTDFVGTLPILGGA